MLRLTTRVPRSPTQPPARPRPVLNVAHRGASVHAPENTLASIRGALLDGADLVEVDVHRTKDGVVVLLHDHVLTRTTDISRVFPGRAGHRVQDFTYDELLELDAGSWHSPLYAGERIPTLRDAVEEVQGSTAGLLVELKTPSAYPDITDQVAEILRDASTGDPLPGRHVVQSFDADAVRRVKAHAPWCTVGLLGTPSRRKLDEVAEWADQVNPRHTTVGRGYVEAVRSRGMQCLVWTVDRPAAIRRAVNIGVDGVITNRPDLL